MLASQARVLRFDAFTLDLSRCALFRGREELALRPKSFDVLRHLAEHAGELVSKEKLIAAVWPGVHVTDDSLVQCIGDIREALGEDGQRIIKTVPRRGYLFAAEIAAAATAAAAAQAPAASPGPEASLDKLGTAAIPSESDLPGNWRGALIAAALLTTLLAAGGWLAWEWLGPERPVALTMMAVPTIAMLPFDSARPGQDIGATALVDEIVIELWRSPRGFDMSIKGLSPSPPGRTLTASELGVRYLVRGNIRDGGSVRQVNVQLIEAQTGRQLWGEPFEYAPVQHGAQNLLATRIARMLAVQVRTAESRRPLPANPQAGHFAMLGRVLLESERGSERNRQARELFEKGLALDPNSVPSLLGYARTRVDTVLNGWVPPEQRAGLLKEAERAIEHMISMDARNVGAHLLRGVLLRAKGDHDHAIASLERALALNPNYYFAHAELGRAKIEAGRAGETATHIERALELSPTDPIVAAWCYWAGMAAVHVQDYEAAVRWLVKGRQANRSYPNFVPWLAVAYAGLGRDEEARALLQEHMKAFPQFSIARWNRLLPRANPVVVEQRERIVAILRRLGAPEDGLRTGDAR